MTYKGEMKTEIRTNFELISGAGSESAGKACWMTAARYYVENREWNDHPECVSPKIRSLCIAFNDRASEKLRDRVVRDWKIFRAPIGTNTGPDDEQARAWLCADWAVRVAAVFALRQAKLNEYADKLSKLAPVVDKETSDAAYAASYAAYAASDAASNAASAASDAAYAASDKFLGDHFLPLILACCKVGKKNKIKIEPAREKAMRQFCGVGK